MNLRRHGRRAYVLLLVGIFGAFASLTHAQEKVGITGITPSLLVFSTSAGNVIASVGNDGVLLVGLPSAASTEAITQALASRRTVTVPEFLIVPPSCATGSTSFHTRDTAIQSGRPDRWRNGAALPRN